jgi:hypothetical protein
VIRPVLEAVARIGRPSVRTVLPLPPYEPEPLPDEPFAPVYAFVPLGAFEGSLAWVPDPYGPDVLVFGAPGTTQGAGILHGDGHWVSCECGVTWHGEAACWHCGRPA